MYVVVHDVTPAFAGVISHLLDVALRTPAIESKGGSMFSVVLLGNADLSAPIASQVVSEVSQIPKFARHEHLDSTLCVLSLSGCDRDVLRHSGLSERATPVVSLSKMAFNKKSLSQLSNYTIKEVVQVGSFAPTDPQKFCDSKTWDYCTDLSETAFLIADCVAILVHALVHSSDVVNSSRTE